MDYYMITDNIKLKNHAHLHDFLLSYLTREFQIPREIIDLSCRGNCRNPNYYWGKYDSLEKTPSFHTKWQIK